MCVLPSLIKKLHVISISPQLAHLHVFPRRQEVFVGEVKLKLGCLHLARPAVGDLDLWTDGRGHLVLGHVYLFIYFITKDRWSHLKRSDAASHTHTHTLMHIKQENEQRSVRDETFVSYIINFKSSYILLYPQCHLISTVGSYSDGMRCSYYDTLINTMILYSCKYSSYFQGILENSTVLTWYRNHGNTIHSFFLISGASMSWMSYCIKTLVTTQNTLATP